MRKPPPEKGNPRPAVYCPWSTDADDVPLMSDEEIDKLAKGAARFMAAEEAQKKNTPPRK